MEEKKNENSDLDLLADLCQCQESCMSWAMYSLKEGGDFAKLEHVRWLLDCADICSLAKNFLIRDSEYAGDILSICSYICDDCAESCETFFEDKMMKDCAMVCRNCGESCRDAIEEEGEEEDLAEEEEMKDKENE